MKRPRVLIIEDHDAVRELLTVALRDLDCEIDQVGDGSVGLERCRSFRPDLVLVDMRLPGLDGPQLIEELRRAPSSGKSPAIIGLTGYAQAHRRHQAVAAGCDAFFEKPLDLRRLRAAVLELLPVAAE